MQINIPWYPNARQREQRDWGSWGNSDFSWPWKCCISNKHLFAESLLFLLLHQAGCRTCCWRGSEEQGIRGIAPAVASHHVGEAHWSCFCCYYFFTSQCLSVSDGMHSYMWAPCRLRDSGAAAGCWHAVWWLPAPACGCYLRAPPVLQPRPRGVSLPLCRGFHKEQASTW